MTKEEMQTFFSGMNKQIFISDLWNHKEEFFNPEDESVIGTVYHNSGLYIIYILQGELDKATAIVDSYKTLPPIYFPMKIVDPTISQDFFLDLFEQYPGLSLEGTLSITCGRPYILNGFTDFSNRGHKFEQRRDYIIKLLSALYGSKNSGFLYDVCLAEYYYQIDKCYEAEVLISHAIKSIADIADVRCLFVALFQQLLLLIVTRQCPSITGYFKEMREKLSKQGSQEIMYNLAAMEAWVASYEGNSELIINWMKTDAPDEYGDFNMLDLFRYTVKLRCYLMMENHIALVALVEKLRPLLERSHRLKDLCLIEYILAMSLHAQGKKEAAFEVLERALAISKANNYNRLAADEGNRMLQLLLDYYKLHNDDEYVHMLIDITRKIAIYYPYYLHIATQNRKHFTEIEVDILRLLEQGKNNQEIADCYLISVNTVKYHLKKIYSKLNVKSANAAVWQAKITGIIN